MTATSFHERHQELAQAVDVTEEQKVANAELIKVNYRGDYDPPLPLLRPAPQPADPLPGLNTFSLGNWMRRLYTHVRDARGLVSSMLF